MSGTGTDLSGAMARAPGRLIDRIHPERRLADDEDFRLVTALGPSGFRARHAIVVYCADDGCADSVDARRLLRSRGFKDVRRYAGGIADWKAARLPIAGELEADSDRAAQRNRGEQR